MMRRPTPISAVAIVALLSAGAGTTRPASPEGANEVAAHARELLRQGDLVGADAATTASLALDRRNPSASYLRGLLAYARGDTPAARRAFDAAAAVVPNDPATLNNLAVVLWRQNQPVPAMLRWDRAMTAARNDRRILDNVAVAEQQLSPEAARSSVVARALKRFHEQDGTLAKSMAAAGYRRVNGAWLSDAEVANLDPRQRQAVEALDQIVAGMAADGGRVSEVDVRLVAIDRELAGITTENKAVVAAPLPTLSRRRELVQEANGLRSERSALRARMGGGSAQADRLRPMLPAPPAQAMTGPEGTPFVGGPQ